MNAPNTIKVIFKDLGIEPAPERRTKTVIRKNDRGVHI
jgi:hypothetical protein